MTSVFSRLPGIRNKNVKLYYLFSIIHGSFFAEGNWIFLYLYFFTYSTIGLLDSIAFTIGLLLEIPSGAIADLIGRKTMVRLSFFFVALGVLTQALAISPLMLFLGNVVFYIGMAFYAGSMEALAYDTLIEIKSEDNYDKIVASSRSLQSLAYILAVLIGGYIASINYRLPFLLWGILHFIGFIASFKLTEPKTDTIKISLRTYLSINKQGIKALFSKKLKPFLFYIFIILGLVYWFDWGFVKPAVAINFGFNEITMGYVFAIEGIVIALVLPLLPKIRKYIGDYFGLAVLNFFLVLCLYLFGTNIGLYGALPIIGIALINKLAYSWITIIINREVESSRRATALSTVSTILKIPYALTAFLCGQIVEAGFLSQMMFFIAFIIGTVSIINLLRNIKLLSSKPQDLS